MNTTNTLNILDSSGLTYSINDKKIKTLLTLKREILMNIIIDKVNNNLIDLNDDQDATWGGKRTRYLYSYQKNITL